MAQFLDLFLACGARGTRRADVGVELPVGVVELQSEQIFALVVEQIFVLALVEQIFLQSIYLCRADICLCGRTQVRADICPCGGANICSCSCGADIFAEYVFVQ